MERKLRLLWGQFSLGGGASLLAQTIKSLPSVWETQDQSLGHKNPLEKEMATHFSIIAWRIPWTKEPDRL